MSRFLLMFAAICALFFLIRSRVFVIREIEVVGNTTRSAQQIAGMSGLKLGMNIFKVKKDMVERNLSADHYVELLNVHIETPDTVILEVKERAPAAAVNSAGVILLIDEGGYILERRENVPADGDIIVVSGMSVSVGAQAKEIESDIPGQVKTVSNVLKALRKAGVQNMISELNAADQDNLYLIMNSGIQVLIGDDGRMEDKLIWMQTVLDKLYRGGVTTGVLDVSGGENATYTAG